jgi:hypothetical protein
MVNRMVRKINKKRNNSALCIPRKCVSKAALLSADIDSISTEKRVDEVVEIVKKKIIKSYQK